MPEDRIHLFRGSPCIRPWSRYQQPVWDWTLCGITRKRTGKARNQPPQCTTFPPVVTCPHCLELMRPAASQARKIAASAGQ